MDRLTFEGLTTGIVTLPGRLVHVGLWLRVLRTLLDEVSMAASRVSTRSAATLARVALAAIAVIVPLSRRVICPPW